MEQMIEEILMQKEIEQLPKKEEHEREVETDS